MLGCPCFGVAEETVTSISWGCRRDTVAGCGHLLGCRRDSVACYDLGLPTVREQRVPKFALHLLGLPKRCLGVRVLGLQKRLSPPSLGVAEEILLRAADISWGAEEILWPAMTSGCRRSANNGRRSSLYISWGCRRDPVASISWGCRRDTVASISWGCRRDACYL